MTSPKGGLGLAGFVLLLTACSLLSVAYPPLSPPAFSEEEPSQSPLPDLSVKAAQQSHSSAPQEGYPVPTDSGDRIEPRATARVWVNATCTNITDMVDIEIDGENLTTPWFFDWDIGSTHHLQVYRDPRPQGCYYCEFTHWENGSTDLNRTIVMNGPMEIMGYFDDYYEVMVSAMGQPTLALSVEFSPPLPDPIIVYPGPDLWIVYVRRGFGGVYAPTPQTDGFYLKTWLFDYWDINVGGNAYTTTENPTTLDLTSVTTCSIAMAYFVEFINISVTIGTNVGPLLVAYDITPLAPAPVTFESQHGNTHTLWTTTPQEYDGSRYEFVEWFTGPSTLDWTVTLPAEVMWEYIADFAPTHHYVNMQMGRSCQGQTAPGSGWYPAGAVLDINWTPPDSLPSNERMWFDRWVGTGDSSYSGLLQNATITVNGPIIQTAYCHHEFLVTVGTDPIGLLFEVDSTAYTTQQSSWWEVGSVHYLNTTNQGGTETRYGFRQWSDGDPNAHHPPLTILAAATYTAEFAIQHHLTVLTPIGSGVICVGGDADCWYNEGSAATLQATSPWPSGAHFARHRFVQWGGDASGAALTTTVLMSAPRTVTSLWVMQYRLTVTSGHGIPACAPATDCWFIEGSVATIEVDLLVMAGVDTRYLFGSWTGDVATGANPATVLMDSSKNVTAAWDTEHKLTILTERGTPPCSNLGCWFLEGSTTTITMDSMIYDGGEVRYVFDGWSGDGGGADNPLSITVDRPKSLTANWRTQYRLTITSECGVIECGSPQGADWHDEGGAVSISVTTPCDSGGRTWVFGGWDGDASGANSTTTVTMDGPKHAIASWKEQAPLHRGGDVTPWVLLSAGAAITVAAFALLLKRRGRKSAIVSNPEKQKRSGQPQKKDDDQTGHDISHTE